MDIKNLLDKIDYKKLLKEKLHLDLDEQKQLEEMLDNRENIENYFWKDDLEALKWKKFISTPLKNWWFCSDEAKELYESADTDKKKIWFIVKWFDSYVSIYNSPDKDENIYVDLAPKYTVSLFVNFIFKLNLKWEDFADGRSDLDKILSESCSYDRYDDICGKLLEYIHKLDGTPIKDGHIYFEDIGFANLDDFKLQSGREDLEYLRALTVSTRNSLIKDRTKYYLKKGEHYVPDLVKLALIGDPDLDSDISNVFMMTAINDVGIPEDEFEPFVKKFALLSAAARYSFKDQMELFPPEFGINKLTSFGSARAKTYGAPSLDEVKDEFEYKKQPENYDTKLREKIRNSKDTMKFLKFGGIALAAALVFVIIELLFGNTMAPVGFVVALVAGILMVAKGYGPIGEIQVEINRLRDREKKEMDRFNLWNQQEQIEYEFDFNKVRDFEQEYRKIAELAKQKCEKGKQFTRENFNIVKDWVKTIGEK